MNGRCENFDVEHGILISIQHGKLIGFSCLEVFLYQRYISLFCSDKAVRRILSSLYLSVLFPTETNYPDMFKVQSLLMTLGSIQKGIINTLLAFGLCEGNNCLENKEKHVKVQTYNPSVARKKGTSINEANLINLLKLISWILYFQISVVKHELGIKDSLGQKFKFIISVE